MNLMAGLEFSTLGCKSDKGKKNMFINQSKYSKEQLKEFNVLSCKSTEAPMSTLFKLNKDGSGKVFSKKDIKGIIGSFLFLT